MAHFNCRPLKEKFFKKVAMIPFDECWHWIGVIEPQGYGYMYINKKSYRAHVIAYELGYGKIPESINRRQIHIDHTCNVKSCVNPRHLRLVTARENVLKGGGPAAANSRKLTCKYGHPLIYRFLTGKRRCLKCDAKIKAQKRANRTPEEHAKYLAYLKIWRSKRAA